MATFFRYRGLRREGQRVRRATFTVPAEDIELLERVYPGCAVFSGIVYTTLYTICNELRRQGTTDYNPAAIVEIIRRFTCAISPGTGVDGDVRERPHCLPITASQVRPDSHTESEVVVDNKDTKNTESKPRQTI